MAASAKAAAQQVAIPVSRDAILAQWNNMIEAVPLADDDDGMSIIANIIGATNWEETNTQGGLPKAEDRIGVSLKIHAIDRHESTIEDTGPWYLVVRCNDTHSGRDMTFQTSSQTVMAQLVKLYTEDAFPIVASVVKGDKPTKRGFWPLALKVIGASGFGAK